MSEIEEYIFKDILKQIEDNLKILISNKDSCLYNFNYFCENMEIMDYILQQNVLTVFTEEALYALLNANFLYDFRDSE